MGRVAFGASSVSHSSSSTSTRSVRVSDNPGFEGRGLVGVVSPPVSEVYASGDVCREISKGDIDRSLPLRVGLEG